jgi:DNA-binding transcriptional LysR family regulator
MRIEATMALSVRQLVARGLGVGIIDPLVASHRPDPAVVVRPFVPAVAFEVAAVLPDHSIQPARVREFVALVRSGLRGRLAAPTRPARR